MNSNNDSLSVIFNGNYIVQSYGGNPQGLNIDVGVDLNHIFGQQAEFVRQKCDQALNNFSQSFEVALNSAYCKIKIKPLKCNPDLESFFYMDINKIAEDDILISEFDDLVIDDTLTSEHHTDVPFVKLFDLDDIQLLQDQFAKATGVASIITLPDGNPITKPSNFSRLCKDIIRKTEKGLRNCIKSDALLGKQKMDGPTISPCFSCGLWDAGAAISVGGKHIANWLIGQVRDSSQNEEKMSEYASEIGADPEEFLQAFKDVTPMSHAQFEFVAEVLFTLANQLSELAYLNFKQKQLILENNVKAVKVMESEKQLRFLSAITVNISDAIIVTDSQFRITYINKRAEELFGYELDELKGKTPDILNAEPLAEDIQKELYSTVSKGIPYVGESLNIRKDGSLFYCEYKVQPVVDKDGRINTYIGIQRDITARKETEMELVEAKEKAEESNRLKSSFLANMSHEIRTPMNGILGFLELLKEPDLDSETVNSYMDIVIESSNRMLSTLNDIINISQIHAGQVGLSVSSFSIVAEIHALFHFFKPDAESKGLKFILKSFNEATLPEMISDKSKVYSIMTNFVKNAIKYTTRGSIEICYKKHNDHLVFSVCDTGIGIPSERLDAIFDRFVQADIEDHSAMQGSGLGLAIAKSYAEMLKGRIEVTSREGEGSEFKAILPWII